MSDVPDALFPSSNDWGIPDLKLDTQADYVDLPATLFSKYINLNTKLLR